jgi:hypothetical protein
MKSWHFKFARGAMVMALAVGALALGGCQRKEKVLDVKGPGGEIKVEKNVDTGQVDVKVKQD